MAPVLDLGNGTVFIFIHRQSDTFTDVSLFVCVLVEWIDEALVCL